MPLSLRCHFMHHILLANGTAKIGKFFFFFITKILNGIIMKVTESNMTNSKCVYKVIMIYNLNDLVIPSRQLNNKVFLLCHCYVNLPKVDLNLSFLKKLMVYLFFYVFCF